MDPFKDKIESSDDEEQIVDEDTCTEDELKQLFAQKLNLATETSVSLKKTYILHLASTTDFSKIAAATSDKDVQVYNFDTDHLTTLTNITKVTDDTITGVRFSNSDSNILFISIGFGIISGYDLRSKQITTTFKDNSSAKLKPITCFDLNSNDRVICGGTESIGSDAFILFFDVRKSSSTMGGYWESHDDDITQVKFHPTRPDSLASGSTDGLINIFDISNTNEDDALQTSLNTESSVHVINWHKNIYGNDYLSCILHTNDFQLYDVSESEMITSYDRNYIASAIKRKSAMDCNVINCHSDNDSNVILLAGSNYNKGECLRSLKLQNSQFSPLTNFVGTKQIVRASIYNDKSNILITGGEAGILSVWSAADTQTSLKIEQTTLKEKSKKLKSHKNKPY